MSKKPTEGQPEQAEAWRWPEEKWRKIVTKVRSGRSLRPKAWPSEAHTAVAAHYDIPTIDLAKEVTQEIGAGSLTWAVYGGVHPAPRVADSQEDVAAQRHLHSLYRIRLIQEDSVGLNH